MIQVTKRVRHIFTVEEYMGLQLAGRTELVEGTVYDVSPRNDPHRFAVNFLTKTLQIALPNLTVQAQDAVFIDGWKGKNAPEPDIAVVQDQARQHPTAETTLVIIEVSDTTLQDDRSKVELYTMAGIPSFIVNIRGQIVEEYAAGSVTEPQAHLLGGSFEALGIIIHVDDLFEKDLRK